MQLIFVLMLCMYLRSVLQKVLTVDRESIIFHVAKMPYCNDFKNLKKIIHDLIPKANKFVLPSHHYVQVQFLHTYTKTIAFYS